MWGRSMCVGGGTCVWEEGHVCGRRSMCVGGGACVWEEEHVCGRRSMCVGGRACLWTDGLASPGLMPNFLCSRLWVVNRRAVCTWGTPLISRPKVEKKMSSGMTMLAN